MKRLALFLLAGLASAAAPRRPFPVSSAECPVDIGQEEPRTCGEFSFAFCSDPIGSKCDFCTKKGGGASLTGPPGFYEAERRPEVIAPEDYLIYKALETEYLVEFSNNPMPFQKAVPMPFCGLPPPPTRLQKRKCNKNSVFGKLGGCKVAEELPKRLVTAVKGLVNGVGAIREFILPRSTPLTLQPSPSSTNPPNTSLARCAFPKLSPSPSTLP